MEMREKAKLLEGAFVGELGKHLSPADADNARAVLAKRHFTRAQDKISFLNEASELFCEMGTRPYLQRILRLGARERGASAAKAVNALATAMNMDVLAKVNNAVMQSKTTAEASQRMRRVILDHCTTKGSLYRVVVRHGKVRVSKHEAGKLVKADFKPVNHEAIAREFSGKHHANDGVYYLHGDGRSYTMLTKDLKHVGWTLFAKTGPQASPTIGVADNYQNRGFGALIAKLALDHYEQTNKVTVSRWDYMNEQSRRIARKLGFAEGFETEGRMMRQL